MTVYRVEPDACKAMPAKVKFTYSLEEAGINPHRPFKVGNSFIVNENLAGSKGREQYWSIPCLLPFSRATGTSADRSVRRRPLLFTPNDDSTGFSSTVNNTAHLSGDGFIYSLDTPAVHVTGASGAGPPKPHGGKSSRLVP